MRSKETRYCDNCHAQFHPLYGRPDSKYCSNACYLKSRWGEAAKPICMICGKPATSTGKRNQKVCSWECAQIAKVGRKNPGRSNRVSKHCDWCGEDVNRPESNFHSDRVFCDYRCMAEWQSEFNVGTTHPRWKGGPPRTYGIGWKAARRAAVARSGGICENCHKSKVRHVHHRLPVRYFTRFEDAHFSNNLIAVCTRCHSAEHRKLASALPLLDLLELQR